MLGAWSVGGGGAAVGRGVWVGGGWAGIAGDCFAVISRRFGIAGGGVRVRGAGVGVCVGFGVVFVADEEVEVAVVVEVGPGGGLGGAEGEEAGADGDVFKGAVAAVVEEREGVFAEAAPPGTAEDEEVGVAVVVVVGGDEIEAAEFVGEAGCGGAIGEGAVAVVVEEVHGTGGVGGGGDDVEETVAVEVFDDGTAGAGGEVDAGKGGHVGPFGEVAVGLEEFAGEEELWRDVAGVAAELHVGDVEEPAGEVVGRVLLEEGGEVADGAFGTAGKGVDAGGTDGKDAGVSAMVAEAVFGFAEAEEGDGALVEEVAAGLGGETELVGEGLGSAGGTIWGAVWGMIWGAIKGAVEGLEGGFGVAGAEEFGAELLPNGEFVGGGELLFAEEAVVVAGALGGFVGVLLPVGAAVNGAEALAHGAIGFGDLGCLDLWSGDR